jgi:NitT/TauT family transport system permease protein
VAQAKLRQVLKSLGLLIGVFALWEIVTVSGLVRPLLLPQPYEAFAALAKLVTTGAAEPFGSFYGNLAVTLYEIGISFALASSAGFLGGITLGRIRPLGRVFEPLVTAFYAIPMIVFYPVMFLTLGIGPPSKIALGTVIAFFPMLVNTIAGVSQVDEDYILLAQSMGATRAQTATKVILPAAIGTIVTGLRLSIAGAVIGVLVSEMTAAQAGLGFLLIYSADLFRIPQLYAFIIVAVIIAVGFNYAFSIVHGRVEET